MNTSIINNLTFNASYLQNNQQPARNIDKFEKNSEGLYPCPIETCPLILSRKYTLTNHILAHQNKKAYSCDKCDGNFNTEKTLMQHKQTHEDKQFTCYTCNRSFACERYLKTHNKSQSHIRNIKNITDDSNLYKANTTNITRLVKHSQQHTVQSNNSSTSGIQSKNHQCPFEGSPSILASKETLNDHILSHKNKKTYSCDKCDGNFNTAKALRQHKTIHGVRKFTCYTCNRSFVRKRYLKIHNKSTFHIRNIKNITDDSNLYKANMTNLTRLVKHSQQHTVQSNNSSTSGIQSKNHQCPFEGSPSILASKETLNDHILSHKNKKTYSCDKCDGNFNTAKALRQHKTIHGVRKFTCYTCNRSFVRKRYLKIHNKSTFHIRNIKNITDDSNLYKANMTNLTGLVKHSQQHTVQSNNSSTSGIQSKNHQCPLEGSPSILASKETLNDHILSHENKKTYSCDKCDGNFNTAKALRQHKTIHGVRKFTCYTCNRSFVRKRYLKTHNKSQSHIRNIKNITDDSNLYKANTTNITRLVKHSQQHTVQSNNSSTSGIQSKNHQCPFEGSPSILASKETLNDHILSHKNKKTYSCDKCDGNFNTANALRQHKTIHGVRKFTCYTCNETFFRKELLNNHNRSEPHRNKINNIILEDPSLVEAAHILLTMKPTLLK